MTTQTIIYRLRYWQRQIINFIGLCHRCGTRLNFTRHGKGVCPECGR